MFDFIRHPILSIRTFRFIYSELKSDPEYLEEINAAETKDEEDKIRDRKLYELFPECAA